MFDRTKNTIVSFAGKAFQIWMVLLLISGAAFAQDQFLKTDGEIHLIKAIDEQYQDFIVPDFGSAKQFNLELEGADGGWIEYSYLDRFGTQRTQRVHGGEGATISATYHLGNGSGMIRKGSTLRFIIGNRGEWAKFDLLYRGGYGAGGGGGSAVLLSNDQGSTWQVLMVAGGGGGAGVDTKDLDTRFNPGLPGSTEDYENAQPKINNKNQAMPSGNRGAGGQSYENSGGGGGIYEDGTHRTGSLYYGNAGWKDFNLSGQPLGGLGGLDTTGIDGGWGFGGGGSGAEGGGGGGGYSGGGSGISGFGGRGGSSYVNEFTLRPLNVSKKQNGDTNNPGDGWARYQFSSREN